MNLQHDTRNNERTKPRGDSPIKETAILHTPKRPSIPATGLLGVLLLALVVRGLLCAEPACLSRDGVQFISFAKQLRDDPVRWMKVTTKQPGFSYLLRLTHRLIGDLLSDVPPLAWQRCGELLALAGGVAVCGLIYALTLRLFESNLIAMVAGLLACFWPHGAHLSADVLSDMPHLALFLFAILLAYDALQRPNLWLPALCGVVAGLAYLIRQEALGLVASVALCLLWHGAGGSRRWRWMRVVVLLLCFAAVVAPYSLAVGRIMPNKGPTDLMNQLFSGPHLIIRNVGLLAHVVPWWQTPGRMVNAWAWSGRYVISTLFLIGLFLRKLKKPICGKPEKTIRGTGVPPVGLRVLTPLPQVHSETLRKPTGGISSGQTVPMAKRQGRGLILAVVLVHLVLILLRVGVYGEISSRYMVIPATLTIPWAAATFVALITRIAQHIMDPTPVRRAAIWLSGYLLVLTPLIYYISKPVNGGNPAYRTAGLWLRDHARQGDRILAHQRLEQLMFYAGRTYPVATWQACHDSDTLADIHRIIARDRPTWFVDAENSHREMKDESHYFKALIGGAVPQLQSVYTSETPLQRVYIFRVQSMSATNERDNPH